MTAANRHDFHKIADEVVAADDVCTAANFLRTAGDEIVQLRCHLEHALGSAEAVAHMTGLATARATVFWIKECLNDNA